MDYEEKYKAALERARQFSEKPYLEDSAGIVEYIFPELKEPELTELKDERIKKALIHFFSNDENTSFEYWEGIPKAEVLAWLKKQGQVKESVISQHENKTCKENNDSLTCEDEKIRKELIDAINGLWDNDALPMPLSIKRKDAWLAWLEKQGEQKEYTFKSIPRLLDMIEPTSRARAYCQKLIDTLVKEGYATDAKIVGECLKKMNGEDVPLAIMDEKKGEQKHFDYEHANIQQNDFAPKSALEAIKGEKVDNTNKVEPKFHEGDWVVWDNKISCHVDDIYQGKNSLMYTITDTNNMVRSYSVKGFDNNAHLWTIQDARSGDVLYTPKGCGVEGIFLIEGWKQVDDTGRTLCSSISYRVKDDEIVAGGLGAIWWKGVIDPFYPATKEQRDLLFQKMKESGYEWDAEKKELKKIEQGNSTLLFNSSNIGKNAWSEEDEIYIENIILAVEKQYHIAAKEIVNWLKSLKERVQPNHWKPTKVQLELLKEACIKRWEPDGLDPLYTLWEHLKNL